MPNQFTEKIPIEERFWSKVDRDTGTSCWEWIGAKTGRGYGALGLEAAHRVAYELLVGPVPAGFDVHHQCSNRRCVNPAHLVALSRKEHLRCDNTLAAANAAKTHCPAGHPYDLLNTGDNGRGHRRCLACHAELERQAKRWRNKTPAQREAGREANRRYYRRKKEASHSTVLLLPAAER